MLKILTVPQDTKILRTKSRPVEKIDGEVVDFLRQLGETLKSQKDPAGVGLSAIQVGKAIRAFALYLPEVPLESKSKIKNQKSKITFYVNPEIVKHAAKMTLGEELTENKRQKPFLEGCLSIPRIYGPVLRYPWIKAKATIITEKYFSTPSSLCLLPSSFTLDALTSRVFQHELDHLNGILFTDHVLAQGNKLYREEDKEMAEMEI